MKPAVARNYFLDLLRIFACFFVIVNHTGMDFFLNTTPPAPIWFLGAAYFFIAKTAVPIFFMISGYLLLGRNDSWKTIWHRIKRILCVLLCCTIIYAIHNAIRNTGFASIRAMAVHTVKEIARVYLRSPSNALWYLYTYIGILIMLPFLQKMAAAMQKKDFHIFFLAAAIYVGLLPILKHYSSYLSVHPKFQLPLFSGYVTMLFIGQYFSRFGIARTKKRFWVAAILFAVSVAFTVIATYFEYLRDSSSFLFYDDVTLLPVAFSSVCFFYMFSFASFPEKISHIVSAVGACTFGIYLISDLLIDLSWPLCEMAYASACPFITVVFYEIGLFLCGLAITAVLRKIPGAKRIL